MGDLEYWKAQAGRWKRAYWGAMDDGDEERREILAKARARAKAKDKAERKAKRRAKKLGATVGQVYKKLGGELPAYVKKKKPTGKKKPQKTVMGEVLSLFD